MINELEIVLKEYFSEEQIKRAEEKVKNFLIEKKIAKSQIMESYIKITPAKDVALIVSYLKENRETRASVMLGRKI